MALCHTGVPRVQTDRLHACGGTCLLERAGRGAGAALAGGRRRSASFRTAAAHSAGATMVHASARRKDKSQFGSRVWYTDFSMGRFASSTVLRSGGPRGVPGNNVLASDWHIERRVAHALCTISRSAIRPGATTHSKDVLSAPPQRCSHCLRWCLHQSLSTSKRPPPCVLAAAAFGPYVDAIAVRIAGRLCPEMSR